MPGTGEQILAKSRASFAQANAPARPSRATTCPCAATCPIWLSALLYSELLYSGQLHFFPFDTHCLWHVRWFFMIFLSFYLAETQSSKMNWIRSGPPSERTKRSILETNISQKSPMCVCVSLPVFVFFHQDASSYLIISITWYASLWYTVILLYIIVAYTVATVVQLSNLTC